MVSIRQAFINAGLAAICLLIALTILTVNIPCKYRTSMTSFSGPKNRQFGPV